MFGVSFTELLLIGAVTLIIVGPQRLPKMLGTLGKWSAKLRRITNEVRYQSGIDDILRKEGIAGGLSELRQLRDVARGNWTGLGASAVAGRGKAGTTPGAAKPGTAGELAKAIPAQDDPFAHVQNDRSREYPTEGCDAYGALPDDMWLENPDAEPEPAVTAAAPVVPEAPPSTAVATAETAAEPAPTAPPEPVSHPAAKVSVSPPSPPRVAEGNVAASNKGPANTPASEKS